MRTVPLGHVADKCGIKSYHKKLIIRMFSFPVFLICISNIIWSVKRFSNSVIFLLSLIADFIFRFTPKRTPNRPQVKKVARMDNVCSNILKYQKLDEAQLEMENSNKS